MKSRLFTGLAFCLFISGAARAETAPALSSVRHFMYQIQRLEDDGAIDALAATPYDLLVVEPTNTVKGEQTFDTARMVKRLQRKPDGSRRLVLAYIDIGQAESYRRYWQAGWRAPTASRPGSPDFIITADPDGWQGNYPVAFWDGRWKSIWLDPAGLVAELARAGFDGVYLDWVEAYADPKVQAAARRTGRNSAQEMLIFLQQIRSVGKAVNPGFLLVQQNAPYLLKDAGPALLKAIDGIAQEDVWYRGVADASWSSKQGGDIANTADDGFSTQALIKQLQRYKAAGLPVLTVDYALQPAHAELVYLQSRSAGFIPLVSRIELSRITETPPWDTP